MKNSFENILNSPWLESIRRFEQTSISTLALQESSALKAAMKVAEESKLASLAFYNSDIMNYASKISEVSKLASLAFHESNAMKSIIEQTKTAQFATLAYKESEAMKSIVNIAKTGQLASLNLQQSELMKNAQALAKTSQFATIALQQSEIAKQIAEFSKLSSFQALRALKNSPFTESTSFIFERETSSDASESIDINIVNIDNQIKSEIESVSDFNELSEKTKKILLYLYHYYFLPVLLSLFSAYIMANAIEARKELKTISNPAKVKAFIKTPNKNFDHSLLKGFRVTTASSLNFRESPGMKSNVITTLPVGTLVETIDKSNRSWLLVEVEIDGKLEQGWISRRYTAYFK